MRPSRLILVAAPLLLVAACAQSPDKDTLASLHKVPADTTDVPVQVSEGLDKAAQSYQRFLDDTPEGTLTPEAMRRLADVKIEKEYGILGDSKPVSQSAAAVAPKAARTAQSSAEALPTPAAAAKIDARADARPKTLQTEMPAVSERELERRIAGQSSVAATGELSELPLPAGASGDL